MRRILHVLLFLAGVAIIYYGFQNAQIKQIGQELAKKNVYVEVTKNAAFFKDWDQNEILDKINKAREEKGFLKLKVNEKLNKSAAARLAVILSEDDYAGTKTGITREAAMKNAGYDANLIGDLVLIDFFKNNDYITYWESDPNMKGTLLHPDFREIGMAIKNDQNKVSFYALLVSPRKFVATPTPQKQTAWGGPELWTAINKRRVENGVNPLSKKDELCTIASIRLNELLELNKLDGHAGFVPVLDRPDLKWISEKYNISEYLVQGYPTPEETVKAWENTLGHKSLLAGGEYVWGCVYAQNTFGVAIAAY